MKLIEKFYEWTFEKPQVLSGFHVFFLILALVVAALLIIFFKDCKERTMKIILLISWVILVIFEVIKLLIFAYQIDHLKFHWGSFPFQFCETPLYLLPILIINKNKKVQHVLTTFFATYVFFAGFALMVYPDGLFSQHIILSIRTMIHHGIQVAIGLFLFVWDRKDINLKTFFIGSIILVFLTGIAITINFTAGRKYAAEAVVNMFWISKDYPSKLMILKKLQPVVPYFVFVISYIVGFTFCAICSYFVELGGCKLVEKSTLNEKENLN